MKKLLVFCISLVSLAVSAQSVDRNDVAISISPGITLNYYQRLDSAGNVYADPSYKGLRAPLLIEYAFNRSYSLYANFTYTRLNTGSLYPGNFTVLDFGGGLGFHSPSSVRKIDWFGHLGLHYSHLYFRFESDFLHQTTTANGLSLYYDIGANIPLSSNEKFGAGICINGSGYRYKNAKQEWENGDTFFRLNGLAGAVGINLYYKL